MRKSIIAAVLLLCGFIALFGCVDPRGSGALPESSPGGSSPPSSAAPDLNPAEPDLDVPDENETGGAEQAPGEPGYAEAYIEIIRGFEEEFAEAERSELKYDLLSLDGDEIPELVVNMNGYWVSLYTYQGGVLHTIMDGWAYGAFGNAGYEYLPEKNVIRNYNNDLAGLIRYVTYYALDEHYELQSYYDKALSSWMFRDSNGNYDMDEEESFDYNDGEEGREYYYFGDREITQEEFNSYLIEGDYEWIYGGQSAATMIARLEAMKEQA